MDAAVRLQQAFRQLPLVLLCLYLLFSPVWYPAAAPRMYDNARSLQLVLLVAVALLTLLPAVGGGHGDVFTLSKASVGVVHDWRLSPNVRFGVGALYAVNQVPAGLEAAYGGDPDGGMLFLRLKVG